MARRGLFWGLRKTKERFVSQAQEKVEGWGLNGDAGDGRGVPLVPRAGRLCGFWRRWGRKTCLGPDFYFRPQGPSGQSDNANHSPAIFPARVAGSTLPPTPARHPPPAPVCSIHMQVRGGSIPTPPFFCGCFFSAPGFSFIPSFRHNRCVRPYYREYT